eukprot:CAMPEP_0117695458 /NCGR_PEP_ID=MMETSP0804-20121206/28150_1 /TAXON_ID=1074897 /ORGANISM="Tetraselmis astigmatica, Strain CCMP880" /LENGTH=49 /DNA_ID=CAMNT_0005509531 /DNA_START=360 /DNA_END=509 /DNA_ORIENTATION=+
MQRVGLAGMQGSCTLRVVNLGHPEPALRNFTKFSDQDRLGVGRIVREDN